ncbi:LysR family transcriptional regulator [Methylobacterium aerolatum]|uniref:DNA-binding transcriptional LysR family regulator n=1 Tax=Methylobacterium aerolatum TaxID=418708 RepID=A0ABU0HYX9_9HYPH|nr:LysR family transcriptional regulator [Methylobacterium aerolatum]MDQ0447541.1 DNA-binding transcriptional LysR family regulator [Methylobacterium aerolatum]GJD34642.1 PCP degradation transcriptional activation protein [Methylobacterium aerolatum]
MAIDHIDLARLDLNLLVALDALLQERSVTRAAARIGIGQSAMSASLARLRRLFDDELFTRAPDGMRPTPRALALAEPLRGVLRGVQDLVHREGSFDPRTIERTFTVSLPDSLEILLGPRLIAYLRAEAPGIRLLLRSVEAVRILDELDADRVDLALGFFSRGQVHHKQRLLYRDSYVVLFNAALVGLEAPIGLEDYLRFPHVLTSLRETAHGVVDDALALIGRSRVLAVTTPRFLVVPFLVQASPVIATMHARLATVFAGSLGLSTSPVPVDLDEVSISMLWHASYDRDPAHRWLRDLLVRLAGEEAMLLPMGSPRPE